MAQSGFFSSISRLLSGKNGPGAVHSFLDKDIIVVGDVHIHGGGIHVEGKIEGNVINTTGKARVVVGRSGLVCGSVTAGSVVLLGQIEGNVLCKHFEIFDSASIVGDIQYQAIMMHGGRIAGRLLPIDTQDNAEEIPDPSLPISDESIRAPQN